MAVVHEGHTQARARGTQHDAQREVVAIGATVVRVTLCHRAVPSGLTARRAIPAAEGREPA